MSESRILHEVMLAVSKNGCLIFRNNVGRMQTADGRFIRYGLHVGSSDLIGIRVRDGKFIAIETKSPGQKAKPHQEAFLEGIRLAGGLAGVAHSVAEALEVIR